MRRDSRTGRFSRVKRAEASSAAVASGGRPNLAGQRPAPARGGRGGEARGAADRTRSASVRSRSGWAARRVMSSSAWALHSAKLRLSSGGGGLAVNEPAVGPARVCSRRCTARSSGSGDGRCRAGGCSGGRRIVGIAVWEWGGGGRRAEGRGGREVGSGGAERRGGGEAGSGGAGWWWLWWWSKAGTEIARRRVISRDCKRGLVSIDSSAQNTVTSPASVYFVFSCNSYPFCLLERVIGKLCALQDDGPAGCLS